MDEAIQSNLFVVALAKIKKKIDARPLLGFFATTVLLPAAGGLLCAVLVYCYDLEPMLGLPVGRFIYAFINFFVMFLMGVGLVYLAELLVMVLITLSYKHYWKVVPDFRCVRAARRLQEAVGFLEIQHQQQNRHSANVKRLISKGRTMLEKQTQVSSLAFAREMEAVAAELEQAKQKLEELESLEADIQYHEEAARDLPRMKDQARHLRCELGLEKG